MKQSVTKEISKENQLTQNFHNKRSIRNTVNEVKQCNNEIIANKKNVEVENTESKPELQNSRTPVLQKFYSSTVQTNAAEKNFTNSQNLKKQHETNHEDAQTKAKFSENNFNKIHLKY